MTGGFHRRTGVPAWVAGLALAAVIGAGVLGGALGVLITAVHPQPAEVEHTLSADQARTQACNAFALASRRWSEAFRAWLPLVDAPGWQWNSPQVAEATSTFSDQEAQIISQLDGLIPTNTPLEVAQAIRGWTNALLEYSAGHGVAGDHDMDDQENQIDDAADDVARVC
jgi:hypothetical protein